MEILEVHTQLAAHQKAEANGKFIEAVSDKGILGSTRMASGICGLIARYRYPKNASSRFKIAYKGGIAYAIGNSFSVLETLRNQMFIESHTANLKKHHMLPSQILKDELKELEDVKQVLAKSHTGQEPM